MRYAVVIEKAKRNYSAYIPDVPGCVATGKTVEETLGNLRDALEFHFEGMREDGDKIPDPESLVDYIDVPVNSLAMSSTHKEGRMDRKRTRARRSA